MGSGKGRVKEVGGRVGSGKGKLEGGWEVVKGG